MKTVRQVPLRRLVDPERPITYGIVQAGPDVDGGVPYIRPTDMTDERGVVDEKALLRTSSDVARAYRRSEVREGDLVFSIGPSYGKVMIVPSSLSGANLTQGTARIAVDRSVVHPRYLLWVLRSAECVQQWDCAVGGATFRSLNLEPLGRTAIPLVGDPHEQRMVARFLDAKLANLDSLIAMQGRLIELLQEKRQAVISQSVTKGLDPKAPTKESGVEWLGKVPTHWDIRRIASISTKITNGYVGPTRDILVTAGVRYLQSLHIKGNQVRFDEPYFVTAEWSNEHRKSILETGDVLIVQTGDIGQVAVVSEDFAGCNCHALIIVSPKRSAIYGEWLSWVLNSTYGFHSLLSIQTGALHPHLNCGNVRDVPVPIPPLREQREIIEFICAESKRFDELTVKARRSIELMHEHRSALISAAVTGKIDVRSATGVPTESAAVVPA